jgi:hypothetical protein
MNDFKETTMVGSYIAPHPSQYALCHFENFKYLKLWYLTQEGSTDAAQHQHIQNNDTFGLTKVNDIMALRQVSTLRTFKNVIPDANLFFLTNVHCQNCPHSANDQFQWPKESESGALA